jgi:phosphatidylglycerol:prolipoprotein diacylglycerol transferase
VLRTLFRIGPVAVHVYGTFLMLGFVGGILLARREGRRLRLPETVPLDLAIWLLVAGVVSARAMFVALNWGEFSARPSEIVQIWREGGLSFHGGLLGGSSPACSLPGGDEYPSRHWPTWRRQDWRWDMGSPALDVC